VNGENNLALDLDMVRGITTNSNLNPPYKGVMTRLTERCFFLRTKGICGDVCDDMFARLEMPKNAEVNVRDVDSEAFMPEHYLTVHTGNRVCFCGLFRKSKIQVLYNY